MTYRGMWYQHIFIGVRERTYTLGRLHGERQRLVQIKKQRTKGYDRVDL